MKKYQNFLTENFHFFLVVKFQYICFRNGLAGNPFDGTVEQHLGVPLTSEISDGSYVKVSFLFNISKLFLSASLLNLIFFSCLFCYIVYLRLVII